MIDAFVEGARSVVQACQLVILAPVAAAVVCGRARWPVVWSAVAGIVVGGWLFINRWVVLSDGAIRWSSLAVLAFVGGLVGLNWLLDGSDRDRTVIGAQSTLAFGVAVVATTWWRPCVGEELGDLLTRGPDAPWTVLPAAAAYLMGVSLPIIALGLIATVWSPSESTMRWVASGAAASGTVLALSVLVGQHGEIVSTLFEWSQP